MRERKKKSPILNELAVFLCPSPMVTFGRFSTNFVLKIYNYSQIFTQRGSKMRETYDLLKLPYLYSESPFLSLPSWQECFSPFFYRPWAFYQASRFRLLVCKIFLFLLFLFISVLAVFFLLVVKHLCTH